MKPSTMIFTGAALMLCACGGDKQAGLPSVGATSESSMADRVVGARVPKTAAADNLLYVGDSTAELVRIFDYSRSDKPVGQIAMYPETLCADPAGNVWIDANYNGKIAMYEFAHDGTGPIAQLDESGGENCAVDPKSGDLAVVHWGYPTGAYVDVFRNAQGAAE